MAGHVDYHLRVEWETKVPYIKKTRQSPDISFLDSEWYLKLCFQDETYFLYLFNKNNENYPGSITITTGIQDVIDYDTTMLVFTRTVHKSSDHIWAFNVRDVYEKLPDLYSTGKFTMFCVFRHQQTYFKKIPVSTEAHLISSLSQTVVDNLQSLSSDWSRFLKDETFSDVKLQCGYRTFSAHRSVLASRSEVFAAMFRNKMAERDTGVVDVQDMDSEVLELLLEYMYSGKVPDLRDDTAQPLYEASDKYAVYCLKNACSEWLLSKQTKDNCLDLLVLADEHSDENFKEVMVSYVIGHRYLLSTETWSAFKKDHPQLAFEVLENDW